MFVKVIARFQSNKGTLISWGSYPTFTAPEKVLISNWSIILGFQGVWDYISVMSGIKTVDKKAIPSYFPFSHDNIYSKFYTIYSYSLQYTSTWNHLVRALSITLGKYSLFWVAVNRYRSINLSRLISLCMHFCHETSLQMLLKLLAIEFYVVLMFKPFFAKTC